MAENEDSGSKDERRRSVRRTFLRQLFIAKIYGDRELDNIVKGTAKVLRVSQAEVQATIDELLAEFDELLAPLVRDHQILAAVGAFTFNTQQQEALRKIWGEDDARARAFYINTFGENSFSRSDVVPDLIKERIITLMKKAAS